MIKIGIYDRYLVTAGGGERYSCKMAEILSRQKGYQVDIITDLFADLEKVSSKLNLDLGGVNLKVFPFLSEDYTKRITENYDIFINATYLSALPACAKRNLYLCYFPAPFDADFKFIHRFLLIFFRLPVILLYKFADRISQGFKDIDIIEGIYDVKRFFLRRGAWSSGKAVIIYKNPVEVNSCSGKKEQGFSIRLGLKNPQTSGLSSINCRVRIYDKTCEKIVYEKNFKICGGCKEFFQFEPELYNQQDGNSATSSATTTGNLDSGSTGTSGTGNIGNTGSGNTGITGKGSTGGESRSSALTSAEYVLEIESDTFFPERLVGGIKDTRKLGIVLYDERKISTIKKIILKLAGFLPLFLVTYPRDLKFLDTYHKIIAISEYSQKWIRGFWSKESIILYPPVDVEKFKAEKKEKIILSVGRIFSGHHNKKQLELAQNFIELFENHRDIMKDFKLVLAGGVEEKPAHMEYLEIIKKISKGYPINVMPNIGWGDLAELFSKALIFWHAAGMGEDKDRHPEKFEHFGITTVEAMASGCIPVVINMGGQTEIIKDGFNGFLFGSWEQLRDITLKICKNEIDCLTVSNNAVTDSEIFSSLCFEKKLLEIIKEEVLKS
ncbi:MAG: glycosyltransferase [Actinobacteria bacterium]|nr:glycosyltransferase [Actinomycetota bacterium]